jgi:hypothetical protein
MYNLFKSPDGELVLVINPQDGEPMNPSLVYDDSDTALLMSMDWTIKLPNINAGARAEFEKAEKIYVVERDVDNIVRDYYARVNKVKNVKAFIIE